MGDSLVRLQELAADDFSYRHPPSIQVPYYTVHRMLSGLAFLHVQGGRGLPPRLA
jgi:hypothetical protein